MRILPNLTRGVGILPPSPSCQSTLALCCSLPFSFIFIDLEHSPQYPLSNLPSTLNFIKAQPSPKPALVRIPGKDSLPNIQHALDSGAQNLLIPMISTQEEAQRVVSAAKFPPLGSRGCASSFWNDFGGAGLPTSKANEDLTLGVQIETLEGISNAASIAATPGVDFVFLGPVDLASAMGVVESEAGWRHEDVIRTVLEISECVKAEGKSVGTLVTALDGGDGGAFADFEVNVALGSQMFVSGAQAFLDAKN